MEGVVFPMKEEMPLDGALLLQLQPLLAKVVMTNYGFKEFGYTKSQFQVFFALLLRQELTMSQVAGFIGSSKEQATRAVAPLAEDGLVERYIDPQNRTRIRIRLTEQGKSIIAQCRNRFVSNLDKALNKSVTPEEKEELFQATQSLIRILNKLE